MKKIIIGALASLSISSMGLAASYVCESDSLEVRAEALGGSALYQLEVLDRNSDEVVYQDVAEAVLGSGVDATFNVPGKAILIIDSEGSGELTFPNKTVYGLSCTVN